MKLLKKVIIPGAGSIPSINPQLLPAATKVNNSLNVNNAIPAPRVSKPRVPVNKGLLKKVLVFLI